MPPSPKRSRRRIPVLRFFLFVLASWFCYRQFTSGWLSDFWVRRGEKYAHISDSLTIPATNQNPDTTWIGWCESRHGKSFVLAKGLGQCSWGFSRREDLFQVFSNEAPSIVNRLRYAADIKVAAYPLQVNWIAPQRNFGYPHLLDLQSLSSRLSLFAVPVDTAPWMRWIDAASGCTFPGPCPHNPLEGGAVPIPDNFDFAGREYLLVRDVFKGIGESPVYPVMPGTVVAIDKEGETLSMELYHGSNIYSRLTGLASIYNNVRVGSNLQDNMPLGRISARDTAELYLEILRNGKFVRWQEFWDETHPIDATYFARFRNSLGY